MLLTDLNSSSKAFSKLLLSILISVFLLSCASAPYQEMSNARQMVALVSDEVQQAGLSDNESIQGIIHKAKNQLAQAKALLNEDKYSEARELAIKASKLARLAKSEINSQK